MIAPRIFILCFVVPALLLLPATVGGPLAQETEQEQLKALEKEIEESQARGEEFKNKAGQVAREGQRISKDLVALAAQIREQEQLLDEIEENMFVLTNQVAAKKEDIRLQNRNMTYTLAALQRLSQRPVEYIIMRPAEAVETVRSASLLTMTLPEIEKKTETLRLDLADLAALKAALAEEQVRHRQTLDLLQIRTGELEALQKEKQALYADFLKGASQETVRREALAREAKDLRSLIEKLENELKNSNRQLLPTPPIPASTSFAKAKGTLPYPARGNVTRRFGAKIAGGTAKGIDIEVRPGAQVIAPFDGRVIYAGQFRTYGRLLIIAHGEGYHTLLAGLGKIDAVVGQWVLAGEPVGSMARTRLASADGSAAGPSPELYLEIRKAGEPINPLPWLKK